jgi:hypothetical protein
MPVDPDRQIDMLRQSATIYYDSRLCDEAFPLSSGVVVPCV